MTIVVLDGYPLNPGDLDWGPLHALGSCTIYDRTASADTHHRAKDAVAVLTNKVVLTKEIIDALPQLRYIGVLATGYNVVDVAAAQARGIIVTNIPAYSTMSVAQTVFALLLELTHHAGDHSAAVHRGEWTACADFSFRNFPVTELAGKVFGIVGFGNIGTAAASIARSFGMTVLATTRHPERHTAAGIEFTDIDTVFRNSDVVSLHCPLTGETAGLVDRNRLAMMKRSALLINTSRGGLVDEAALADALNEGRIAGAGLDVLSTEPPAADNPLLHAAHCIITPHLAWGSLEARTRLMQIAVDNLRAFIDGHPVNVVHTP